MFENTRATANQQARTTGGGPGFVSGADFRRIEERRLMRRIFQACGEPIGAACAGRMLPSEFLGALTAVESSGREDATRFEPSVYRALDAVARGAEPRFGSIDAGSLRAEVRELLPANDQDLHGNHLHAAFAAAHGEGIAKLEDGALRELACSWGYTQIMGYHMVGRPGTVRDLLKPDFHFQIAVELIDAFAARFHLDVRHQFAELFRCWNTGRPDGRTFDPDYVEKALARMRLYRQMEGLGNMKSEV